MTASIFITGFTGLIGHALALRLLERCHSLVVLARSSRTMSAQTRVDRLLLEASPDPATFSAWRQRVRVIDSDVLQPRFGLSDSEWGHLVASVSSVVHCAAALNFMPEEAEAVRKCNLEGTQNVYQLAADAHLPTFHHVSTAYVCGAVENPKIKPTTLTQEQPCLGRPTFNNAYEESKFLTEQEIGQLDARFGLRSTIYRPSCVIGDYQSGQTISFRTIYGFIDLMDQERRRLVRQEQTDPSSKTLVYFSDIPEDTTRNIVPVNYVVDAMTTILNQERFHGKIYHLTHPNPPNRWLSNVWMARALGFGGLTRPKDVDAYSPADLVHFQPGRLARFNRVFAGYLEDHEPVFDSTTTSCALESSGIQCPPIDQAYFERIVRYCIDTRWRADVEKEVSRRMEEAGL